MAGYRIIGAPQNLGMDYFLAQSHTLGALAKNCRFAVRILPAGTNNLLTQAGFTPFMRDLTYMAESTEMPGRSFTHDTYRYHGPSFVQPFISEYEPVNITFLCRTKSFERQLFDDWMEIINPTDHFDFSYRKDFMAEITIFQLSEYSDESEDGDNNGVAEYAWTLHDAWPMVVDKQSVTWADPDIQRLSVSFTYKYWSRKGRDPEPSTFGPLA